MDTQSQMKSQERNVCVSVHRNEIYTYKIRILSVNFGSKSYLGQLKT